GVVVGEVERSVDDFLLRDLRLDVARSEENRVRDDLLGRLQASLGNTNDPGSLTSLVNGLTDGLRQLASNPESQVVQSQLLRQAEQFADGVNLLADQIQGLRSDADGQIKTAVDSINQSLTDIDRLNNEVARLTAAGQSTADLEDQRDQVLRMLSKQMDVNV